MCILVKLFDLHVTRKDRLDLLYTGVTIADIIWLVGDAIRDFQWYHTIVGTILVICTIAAIKIVKDLCMSHHRKWVIRHVRIIETQVTKQSDK